MTFFWPFKRGADDVFRVSDEKRFTRELYDSVGGIPKYTYEQEYGRYQTRKWRKGLIHSLAPSAMCGAGLGFAWGLYESRRGMIRYTNRFRVITHQMMVCTSLSLSVAFAHHMIVVACDYREMRWQPMAAGCAGGIGYSMLAAGGVNGAGMAGGLLVGFLYTTACLGVRWYDGRHHHSFFRTQQQRETPIHKIAPELQLMYRAWLFDNRPVEELDELRRRALTKDRDEKDMRLDAQAYREAMKLQPVWDAIALPEWWPLKMSEQDVLLEQRMRDDANERRKKGFLDAEGEGAMLLTHVARTEQGRSVSGEVLWEGEGVKK